MLATPAGLASVIGRSHTKNLDAVKPFNRVLDLRLVRVGVVDAAIDFGRVVALQKRRLTPAVISRVTGLREKLVSDYLDLAHEYDRPENQVIFERLLLRFGPLESDGASDG